MLFSVARFMEFFFQFDPSINSGVLSRVETQAQESEHALNHLVQRLSNHKSSHFD
jgi:hypothetical protein